MISTYVGRQVQIESFGNNPYVINILKNFVDIQRKCVHCA